MRKLKGLLLSAALVLTMAGCSGSSDSGFTGGTYEGSAQGFSSEIKVSLTLDDSKTITDVTIVESGESPDIGEMALPLLAEEVVATNNVNVDTIANATVTSNGFIAAAIAALEAAGLTPEDLVAKTTETAGGEQTIDTDVVVLGAGGAGMSAAIAAAKEGASVLVIEKAAFVGGNTSRATGGMNAAKTPYQDENEFAENAGVEATLANARENYPELDELTNTVEQQYNDYLANPEGYFDSVELFMLDTLVGGHNLNNHDLVETLVSNTADAIEWLRGLDTPIVLDDVSSFGGASVKRIHRPVDEEGKTVSVGAYIVPLLEQNAKDLGVEFIFNTSADEILVDENGNVTGVHATDGSTNYTVNADSVVLATGGFGGNLEMVSEYRPDLDGFISTNAQTVTGDGIKMATAIGAGTVDMDQIQIHPTVHQETAGLITEGLRGDGAILVNQEGVRFCDEVGTRDAVSAAELAQTGGYAYLIVDQKMVDASNVIAGYINKGYTIGGGDVAQLAEAIGCDEATLQATLDTWNGYVADGADPEFNRTSFAEPLDTAPYYAIKIAPGIHHTMGGVTINTDANVLDGEGNIINGLFAAGEVTGGVHGGNRLGGNAVADIIVFGRIAGTNAAANVQ